MPRTPHSATRASSSGREKAVKPLPDYARPLLERLLRLRVCTARQAHLLTPALAQRSLRNAYHRLAGLVAQGWLVTDAIVPSRGTATAYYYRPSFQALASMGLASKVGYLQRPPQHVLEYLLFRVDVYVQARAAGWFVASPYFLAPAQHAGALTHLNHFLQSRAQERLRVAQAEHAAPARVAELKVALERLPHFAPKALTFEFLFRADPRGRVSDVVLLLVDDVRRSVAAQVDALPLAAKGECRVLIRDCDSVWNAEANAPHLLGPRLGDLRRAVSQRFLGELPEADVLPHVWAHSVGRSAVKPSPRSPSESSP